jgi:predicted heme/steroid binding protein
MAPKTKDAKVAPLSRGFNSSILLITALLAILASFGASKALNGNYLFNLSDKNTNPQYWMTKIKGPVNLTESDLASYDGKDGRPIYLAVNGSVYDVSASPELYGPGGSYSFFTGKDGARAYITGCFATDLTHDLRGVPEEEWIELVAWKLFYETHTKYFKVGTVHHPPIDPRIPPPAPCMHSSLEC